MDNFAKYWWQDPNTKTIDKNKVEQILNSYSTCIIVTSELASPDVNLEVRSLIRNTVEKLKLVPEMVECWHSAEMDFSDINMNVSEWDDPSSILVKKLIGSRLLVIIGLGYENIKTTNLVRYILQMRTRSWQKNILVVEIPQEEYWGKYGLKISKEQVVKL